MILKILIILCPAPRSCPAMQSNLRHYLYTFQSYASHNIPQMGMIPKSMPNSSGDSSTDLSLLKFYIDKKFLELEDKLTKKIEQNSKIQDEKLDTIIKLLEHQRSINL